jgi:hypothetical protein
VRGLANVSYVVSAFRYAGIKMGLAHLVATPEDHGWVIRIFDLKKSGCASALLSHRA